MDMLKVILILLLSNLQYLFALKSLQLTDNFGQEKEFQRYIVQEGEKIFIDLNDHFRGNFLNFIIQPTNQSSSAVLQLIQNGSIAIQRPIEQKIDYKLRESFKNPWASVKLEALYQNEQNQYFIYIDELLNLNVLDISTYYSEISNSINKVSTMSLFDLNYLSSQSRICAHFFNLYPQTSYYLVFCLSNLQSSNATLIQVDMTQPSQPLLKYLYTPLAFEDLLSGDLIVSGLTDKGNYLMIQTKNRQSSQSFRILEMDRISGNIMIRQEVSSLTFRNSINITQKYDVIKISNVAASNGRLFIADYNIGIFIAKIQCYVDQCTIEVLSIIQLSKVELIRIAQDNTNSNTRIIAAISSPPELIEIEIQDINSPYIYRFVSIKSDAQDYISLKLLDSNPAYIAFQILRIGDMRPIIRIYTRIGPLKSFGIEELDYVGFYGGSGDSHYLKFLDFNHLIVKTSDSFKIYKIRLHQLVIQFQENSKDILNQTMVFSLNVKDSLENFLSVPIEIRFESQNSQNVILQIPDGRELRVYYTCGKFQNVVLNQTGKIFVIHSLDQIFSGTNKFDYTLTYNGQEDYNFLQASNPKYLGKPIPSEYLNLTDCSITSIVKFSVGNYFDNQMICISKSQFKIIFFDIIEDEKAKLQPPVFSKLPNYQEPKPQAYLVDTQMQIVVAFTISEIIDQTQINQKQVIWQIQFFKIFNVFAWIRFEEIDQQISNLLSGYNIAKETPITYNKFNSMGLIRFETQNSNGDILYQFFAFMIEDPMNSYKSLKLLSRVTMQLQGPQAAKVIDMKVAETGNFWIVLSNRTIIEYQLQFRGQVDLKNANSYNWFEYYMRRKLTMLNIKSVRAMDGWNGKLIIFQGQNEIAVHKLDQTRVLIKSNYTLPLSANKSEQQNFQKFLAFSINQLGQVVYALEKNIIFVLYNDTRDVATYYLIAYKINSQRHDTILLEMLKIDKGISVNPNDRELNIHLYSQGEKFEESEVAVIIQTSNGILSQKVLLHPQIELTFENAQRLDQLCLAQPSDKLNLQYELCPLFQNQSCLNITLEAENTGLLIKRNFNSSTLVINQLVKDQQPLTYQGLKVNGACPTLRYFEGFNMIYDYRLISEAGDTDTRFAWNNSEGVLKASNLKEFDLKTQRRNITIEFISKNNKMLDFFSLGDVIVIFDQEGYFNVVSDVKGNIYVRVKSETFLGCAPSLFTILYQPYFMYQCEYMDQDNRKRIKFGITKVYTEEHQLNLTEEDLNQQYVVFKDLKEGSKNTGLKVKRIIPTLELQLPVTHTCVYEQTNAGDSEENNITAIISYDIPGDIYQSVIIVYTVKFNHTMYLTDLNVYTRYISPARMNLNSFRVTALEFIPGTDYLTLGILDFGLLIYSLGKDRVVKQLSLQEYTRNQNLNIKTIIMQDRLTFHLLLETLGIISVGMNETEDLESLTIDTYFNFLDKETTSINNIGQHPQGFTFLTSQPVIKDNQVTTEKIFRVRLFTFYDTKNKKLLAGREFQEGIYCDKLKSIPFNSLLLKDFSIEEGEQNEMWNAFVCGEDLYFFDFYVDLNLYFLSQKDRFNRLDQKIELYVWNNFSRQNMTLEIQNIQENEVQYSAVSLFGLFILAVLSVVFLITKDCCECKKRVNINRKSESIQMLVSTQRSESSCYPTLGADQPEENSIPVPTDYIYGSLTTANFKRKSTLPGLQEAQLT